MSLKKSEKKITIFSSNLLDIPESNDIRISDAQKIKAVVMRKLGFSESEISSRFGISNPTLKKLLKGFRPPINFIQKVSDEIIEGLSQEMMLGFKDEVTALNDVYYVALNKLRLKVQFDNHLSVADLKGVVEMAYKIKEGNPFDDQINLFFQQVTNKQEIIEMANAEPKLKESEFGTKKDSGSEAH